MITQARRSFSAADQVGFAELSGDWSAPLREPSAVHAIQLVTWALDEILRHDGDDAPDRRVWLDRVVARFARPVLTGAVVELEARDSRCVIRQAGEVVVEMEYELGSFVADFDLDTPSQSWPRSEPLDLSADQLADTPEMVPLVLDRELAWAIAPHLAARLAAMQFAELISASRIVGMHGLGVKATIDVLKLTARPGWLLATVGFQVSRVGDQLEDVALALAGPTMIGHVETTVR